MTDEVIVVGLRELGRNIHEIEGKARTSIEEALIKSALFVERDAKLNSPVDTGRLRASISHVENDFGTNNPSVEIGTNVEYAQAVEYGTSKKAAHPFLFPAFNSNKQKILKEIARALMRSGL